MPWKCLNPFIIYIKHWKFPIATTKNGMGVEYPRGLSREDIPLSARIFAVVDVWDAVTSDRPYRAAWTADKALAYIKSESGKLTLTSATPSTTDLSPTKGLPAAIVCDYLTREASRGRYAPGTEFHIGKVELVTNTGTYVDSPFHRYEDGKDLSEVELGKVR
jgi:hypothetical protein